MSVSGEDVPPVHGATLVESTLHAEMDGSRRRMVKNTQRFIPIVIGRLATFYLNVPFTIKCRFRL